jgi:hypothetical protein
MTIKRMLIPLLVLLTPQNKILQPINRIRSLSVTFESMFLQKIESYRVNVFDALQESFPRNIKQAVFPRFHRKALLMPHLLVSLR